MDDPKFRSQVEVLAVVAKGRRREWTGAAHSATRHPPDSPAASINARVKITPVNRRKLAVGATLDPMALTRLPKGIAKASPTGPQTAPADAIMAATSPPRG